jgi:hypothetical protein
MKNKLIFLLIFFVQIVFPQSITQEEKNEIINNLDSTRHSIRLEAIINVVKNGITEALPKLESKIFYQEKDIAMWYLRAISSFNSPNTISISHRFIDTIDYLPNPSHLNFTESTNRFKVQATEILFNRSDYSTTYVIFDYIEEKKPAIAIASFNLLDEVLNHVPEFELQAKNELRRIMLNFNDDNYSPLAIIYLTEKYGQEMIPDLLDVLENVTSNTSKNIAFENLEELNYSELENLTKTQFLQDSARSWIMLNKLLTDYNTPSNYKFILDNYKTSVGMDQVAKYDWLFQSDRAIPFKDYDLVSDYLDFVSSLCDTLPVYTWLGDLQFKDELKSTLQSAKTNLQNGDSLACAVQVKSFQDNVDNVYADSLNTDPRFVTIAGWKFLYWNAQYILDRLQKVEATKEDE